VLPKTIIFLQIKENNTLKMHKGEQRYSIAISLNKKLAINKNKKNSR
jgi:hypothetical protein